MLTHTWVSGGKIQYILIFPGEISVYTHFSGGENWEYTHFSHGKNEYGEKWECNNGVKLVFLHIPIYSIYEHNKAKGRDWENYKAKDVILHKQIQIVINYIDDINRILNIQYTPKFSADLQKSKKKTPFSRVKYSYTFSAYSDGVHPGSILAKLWLTRLCKLVHDLCY